MNKSLVIKTALLWLFLCLATGVPIVISAPNAEVDLGITKTDSVDPAVAGEALTYRLSLSNTGPFTATGVIITDTLPGGVTFTSASTGCQFNAGLRIVRCGMGEVGVGAVTSATIQVRVDSATTGSLLNEANITTLDTDTNGTNNSAQATTTITSSSDLHLAMSAPSFVIAGDVITYSLAITNTGPSDARGVTLRDDFPGGTSFVRSSIPCSPQGHRLTCVIGVVAANTHTNLAITLLVDPGKTGTVNNDAIVSATTPDPNAINNDVTLSTPVVVASDIAISKSGAPDPIVPGALLTYTIRTQNNGLSNGEGVTISDTLPSQLAFQSYTATKGTCTGTTTITCTAGSALPGEIITVTLVGRVNISAGPGVITNTVSAQSTSPDPNLSNNSASDRTTITVITADLHLIKHDLRDPIRAGDTLTYTVTVSNTGPAIATGVIVTDTLPVGAALASIATSQGTCLGTVCALGSISVTNRALITMTANVLPTVSGVITNTARVSATESDPLLSNNSAYERTTILPGPADLRVSKHDLSDPVRAGEALTYTITVSNTGPANATGVIVTDTLPAGAALASITTSQGTCSGTVCALGSISVTNRVLITVTADVLPTVSGVITNTARVTATESDPVLGNNTAYERTTILPGPADLQVSKIDLRDPVRVGEVFTYTITVSNTGPANATGVIVTDTLPAGAALASIATSQGTCSGSVCALGAISVTNRALITVTANVLPTVSGVITNTARVTATESDPVLGNNTAYERTTILPGPADIQVSKIDLRDPIRAGELLTYTITVSNTGPANATGVVVTEILPVSAALASISASQGTCVGIICSLGTINVSNQALITMSVNVYPTITGVITNTAMVSADGSDPVLSNNTVHERTTILPGPADLRVSKHDLSDPVRAGELVTYTITVSNTGPAHAVGVIVTDTLPAGAALASIATSQGTCSGTVCALGSINVSNRAAITVTADVLPTVSGVITNTARVSSTERDPVLSNNTAYERTTILPGPADIRVAKHDQSDPILAGEVLTYTITISNTGPAAGSAVVVTDTLPVSVTLRSATPSQGTCVQARCELGTIPDTSRATVTLTVDVDPSVTGVISNSVSVSSDQVDPVFGNNNALERTTIIQAADLSIEKTGIPEPVFAGRNLAYRLRIMNHGPSSAAGIHLVDVLPTAVRFISAPAYCIHSDGSVDCSLGRLQPGASTVVTITVNTNLLATGLATNTASVSAGSTDPIPANNQSEWTTRVLAPDNEIPTVSWIQPVSNGQRINVGCQMLHLQVNATDNMAVQSVRFYRWDTTLGPTGGWVDIGADSSLPFEWELNTCSLAANWNQVFAQSQDTYGNLSMRQFIWVYRYVTFLPMLSK